MAPEGAAVRLGAQPAQAGRGDADRMRNQALLDTGSRVAGGASVYAVAWLVICIACNTWASHPWLVSIGAVWMGGWGVHRYWLCKNLPRLVETRAQWANKWLVRSVLAQGLAWGLLAAICHATPELHAMNVPIMLVGIAMCSTGSASLAIHRRLMFWFPVLMVLPGSSSWP
ncbi:MAG: hypothetical protein QM742_19945 [Aquabacterium sp.]